MKWTPLTIILSLIILALLLVIYTLIKQQNEVCSKQCDAQAPMQYTPFTDAMRQAILVQHSQQAPAAAVSAPIIQRDRRVLEDPLYPPLNRSIHPVADAHQGMVQARAMHVPTRPDVDTFRLLGYYVNADNKADVWKLFGRQLYARGTQGAFYVMPTDRNQDVKIPIDANSDIVEPRLRDLYNLPTEVRFKHPMFQADATYQFVELKTGDPVSALYF